MGERGKKADKMKDKIIAVDLGGTNIRVGIVQISKSSRKVLKYDKGPTPKTEKELVDVMIKMISYFDSKDVIGIGVGSPGPLANGVILNPPNLPFKNYNLKKVLQYRFKKKVVIENDAKCVALAEAKLGCRKKNFIILTLGTGIGGGIIMDNKLYTGSHGYAGEIGGLVIDNGKSFETLWKEKSNKIKELLENNDKKEVTRISRYLGQGIASLINVFDPEVVVLMGGAREAGNKFLDMIKKEAKEYVVLPSVPTIQWSKINHPGILGASLLIK
jgi:glucokinase